MAQTIPDYPMMIGYDAPPMPYPPTMRNENSITTAMQTYLRSQRTSNRTNLRGRRLRTAARTAGHQCCYCMTSLTTETITMEHIIPLQYGGTNDISNLTIACQPCNSARGSQTIGAYLAQNNIDPSETSTIIQQALLNNS